MYEQTKFDLAQDVREVLENVASEMQDEIDSVESCLEEAERNLENISGLEMKTQILALAEIRNYHKEKLLKSMKAFQEQVNLIFQEFYK